MPAFNDPRSCLRDFFRSGSGLVGRRTPSFSLRNIQRDIRSITTRIENVGTRFEGAIGAAVRGDFLPGQLLSIGNEFRCPPTPYANYFSQHRPPKFKFMFFVSVSINPDFYDAFGGENRWAEGDMWWFIKQSGRPNVSYEYEEVNMYNFRQKVLRRATLNPIQIQMYDDLADASASFWNTFLRIQSPVTNLGNVGATLEESGMNWTEIRELQENLGQIRNNVGELPGQPELVNSASTGVLPGSSILNASFTGTPGSGFKQIIKEINVFHLIDWGQKYVRYQYVNPRINEINFDELTWESSDPSVIDVTFEYDTFHIHMPQGVTEDEIAKHIPPAYAITPNQDETPFEVVNQGIDKFNTGVQAGVNAVTRVISTIPGADVIRRF